MKPVVLPFHRFSRLIVSNVYLLDGGRGDRWLIDTGHWSERWQLLSELKATGLQPGDLTGVLLTHRHSDHAGNAAYLQQRYGAKIYAHRADAEVLAGTAPRFALGKKGGPIARMFGVLENRFPARVQVDGALDHGDQIASLEVHSAPGHTEGSVLFRHAGTRCLLTGDTLLTARPPLTVIREIVRAYDAYSVDVAQANASLDAFHQQGWHYEHLLAGHGRPLVGSARSRVLSALAARDEKPPRDR